MNRLLRVIAELTRTLQHLIEVINKLANAHGDVAREQRVTNLIVCSQITTDPIEKERLLAEARQRMDAPQRSRDLQAPL